jgi:hypothetical protein
VISSIVGPEEGASGMGVFLAGETTCEQAPPAHQFSDSVDET